MCVFFFVSVCVCIYACVFARVCMYERVYISMCVCLCACGSQGAQIREVRMCYELISLGCGKCNTTSLHCFPTKHNYVYGFL